MKNIEQVFVENGYSRNEVKKAMDERRGEQSRPIDDEEEESIRGIVSMPNIPKITHKVNKIAIQHKFKATNKTENKVRTLSEMQRLR